MSLGRQRVCYVCSSKWAGHVVLCLLLNAECCSLCAASSDASQPVQVREEQEALRPDPKALVTAEVLGGMTYTRQVVREILRYRPPAPMVPQARCLVPPLCRGRAIALVRAASWTVLRSRKDGGLS